MNKVLIANQNEVAQLLPMAVCFEVMSETLQALAGRYWRAALWQ